MRRKWLGSITTMLVAAGAAWAQAPAPVIHYPSATGQAVEQAAATADAPPPPAVQVPPSVTPAPLPPLPSLTPGTSGCGEGSALPFLAVGTHHSEYNSGPDADVWVNAEYIVWWLKNERVPQLIGTAPTADVQTGALLNNISSVYGDTTVHYHQQSGVRVSAGGWINESHTIGLDASFFQLERKPSSTTISSPGDPVIGPVFFDPVKLEKILFLASLPVFTSGPFVGGQSSAVIGVKNSNQLWGADANARIHVGALFFMDHLDILLGYRQLYFSESLDMSTASIASPGDTGPNEFISDHFGTRNQFYGGQFGFASHGSLGRFSFDGVFKFAMGDVHEVLNINGSTTLVGGGFGHTTTVGGVYAEPTNIGHHNKDQFGILPELTLTAGYQLTQHARATIGYNLLYLSQVLRAGDQLDQVDSRQVKGLSSFIENSGATQPQPRFFSDRFYAQGLNLGLEFSY